MPFRPEAVGGDDCVPEVRLADFGSAFRQYQQINTARDYTAAYRYIRIMHTYIGICTTVCTSIDIILQVV